MCVCASQQYSLLHSWLVVSIVCACCYEASWLDCLAEARVVAAGSSSVALK